MTARTTSGADDDPLEGVDLLVLDVHGVVFNRPLHAFLGELGERTGEGANELHRRWHDEIRVPFWDGSLGELDMWHLVAPRESPAALRAALESRYRPGPLYHSAVLDWPGPRWLLSNHRTDWLLDRLKRFDIDDRFERILVSDAIRAVKPDVSAFESVVEAAQGASVLFVDDQERNAAAARDLGIRAGVVGDDGKISVCRATHRS